MVSYRQLQAAVEAALAAPRLSPQNRAELTHLLHICLPDFQSFLQFPLTPKLVLSVREIYLQNLEAFSAVGQGFTSKEIAATSDFTVAPKTEDRSQVVSKEVKLPDAPPTTLDNQDAQIALKLSEDFHLNEVYCVSLLVASHQEWNHLGRDPLEVLRLTAGLWFTERRALINTLLLLLRTVVLDQDLDSDFVADIRQYIEGLLDSGLRKMLMQLIKELNRDEPAGTGGPGVEPYVMDPRGAVVPRHEIAQRERLNISQCLVYTCLIVRINAQEAKDLYNLLKDTSMDASISKEPVKLQTGYTIMFSLLNSFMSDSLAGGVEMGGAVLAPDLPFRRCFHELINGSGLDTVTEGFTGVIRFVWAVFLVLTTGMVAGSTEDEVWATTSLNRAFEHDVFGFLCNRVIRTASFQNDEDDLLLMYNMYLHKLLVGFLSQPLGRDKIRELKELAMMSDFDLETSTTTIEEDGRVEQQALQAQGKPFVSLLELLAEVYQRDPELMRENEVVWNFVRFAGEDHTSYVTLVAFLHMLTALASSEDGAKRVHQLMQNKSMRTVGWHTLFNSLNVYEQQFRQMKQSTGALLPSFPEGDARALEAYLGVLRQVVDAGNELERAQWFPDIEPLFKLLSYENVPPRLKGALRGAITSFVPVSPVLKDKVWRFWEQYDLPVIPAPLSADGSHTQVQTKVHDMALELNEVEARQEEYPSTLSYLELLNVLIASDTEHSDKGHRYIGIFRFVRDQVFASYLQRAYADPVEKWQLVVAALRHFQTMLSMYQLTEEDIRNSADHAIQTNGGSGTGVQVGVASRLNLPAVELMKDFMSGKVIFRNVMGILMLGTNGLLEERATQLYGPYLEEAVQLSLQLILLALTKDSFAADFWRPAYQPLDVILSRDGRQIVTLLEYVRYEPQPLIQQYSIQITSILSARIPQLVSIIMESGAASYIVEDYAACLESRIKDLDATENPEEDTGSLILRLLLENLDRPAPNITHLLLRFDVDQPVERTSLQPKRHYSCLRAVLDMLDTLDRPEVNYVLHELGFELMYELCMNPVTSGPTVDLLRIEKYSFFSKHLDALASDVLPSRSENQALRVSSLQQRAWLLKLVALELHLGDMDVSIQRESCRRLLAHLFLRDQPVYGTGVTSNSEPLRLTYTSSEVTLKIKVLELLDIVQFQLPDVGTVLPDELQSWKDELKVDEILSPGGTVDLGGVYRLSERGDRLIDISALRDRLWQEYKRLEVQHNILVNGQRQAELREAVKQLIRWAWRRNINLEEQAAQLHMLVGWTQLVEVAISRRFEFLGNRPQVLFEIVDASLSATVSVQCSLRMASVLSQVVLTAMAKLQELSIVSPGEGESTDDVTYIDLLTNPRLSNSACHTILSKLIASILRHESSENLRRRQFATLLRYVQYCQGMVNYDLPPSVMRTLLVNGVDGEEDAEMEKLDREQTDLVQGNFSILKQEATALVDVVARDAMHGTEVGKAIAFYVLDSLLGLDRQQVFLSQLQSRGLLQTCLADISNNSYQAVLIPSPDSVRRLYTVEAELALLLRVSYHTKRRGAQALFAMGALRSLSSCRAIDVQLTEPARWEQAAKVGMGLPSQHDRQHQIVAPVLRLVLCFTSLLDTAVPLEKGQDEVAAEILEFCKTHQGLLDRILRDDSSGVELADLEELQLVTAILSKVWPLEDSLEFGFTQALFNLAYIHFSPDSQSRSRFIQHLQNAERITELSAAQRETVRKMELLIARIRCNLVTFVYSLVTKQGIRLHITRPELPESFTRGNSLGRQRQPTLKLVVDLLQQSSFDLESALEEKALLLAKLQDVNELSRHEVDLIIKSYGRQEETESVDTLRKRRYLAMAEMCSAAGAKESLITSLMYIVEHTLEILYIHNENRLSSVKVENITDDPGNARLGTKEEINVLTDRLLPVFDRLGALSEGQEKVGHTTQHLQRLVHALKSRIRSLEAP